MKFINWQPHANQPMSGGGSSSGGGGSSYNPNTRTASTARGKTVKPKASKPKGASTLQIVKAADGGKLTSVDSRNTFSDTLITGAGKLLSTDFKTDSNTYSFSDKDGGSQTTTIRDTTAFGKTATTNTVEKRKDASGNITEIKGMSPTEFARSASGGGDSDNSTTTASTPTAKASAPAQTQPTASANTPIYDQTVEEKKVSAKRKLRRRGKRGLRVSKTAVSTGGSSASGLSIPKG